MEASEMRNYERAAVCCPADLFLSGAHQPEHAFVTDLCEGGAYIQTRHKLRRGDRVFMRVALSDEQVAAVASEVTWVKRFDPVSVDGRLPGVGVRFVDLSGEDRSLIRGFLRSSAGQPLTSLPPTPVDDDDVMQALPLDHEPSIAWHDTDVDDSDTEDDDDDDDVMSLGYEPDLGELSLDRPEPEVHSRRSRSGSLTPWLAAASLVLGVGAGALYGLLAPSPQAAALESAPPPTPELVAIEPSPGEAVTAPNPATDVKVAKPETRTASPTPAKTTMAKAQAPAPTPEAAAKPTATPKNTKAAPPAVPAPKTRAGEVVMARAAQASNGWYLTLRNAASTSKGFALGGPPRAVVDLPPGSAPSLSNQDLARGPFGNLRVGRTSTRVRLVFDLTGVVSPSQIRFVTKGQDLVIEVPNQAQARR